jgi:predicted nucleic acid-binding protein
MSKEFTKETASQILIAEPPSYYIVKPPAVVDASLLCSILFNEAQRDSAAAHLSKYTLHAPQLIQFEIVSVAQKKIAIGHSVEDTLIALDNFTKLNLFLHSIVLTEQLQLAQQYSLSTYDAAYLWLAAHLKAPLLTFDKELGKAAKVHLAGLE